MARSTLLRTVRLVAATLLLVLAGFFTWQTIGCLAIRRQVRTELAEISHARYDLLNATVWVGKITPILEAQIDSLDLQAGAKANLRPTVEKALYRLLDDVKNRMSAKPAPGAPAPGGFLAQGNAMIANMVVAALRPQVPQFSGVVLAELGRPETKKAIRNYIKSVLADSARTTFGAVDMRWYNSILQQNDCPSAAACKVKLAARIQTLETHINRDYLTVLGAAALAFLLLLTAGPVLTRLETTVLLLFCLTLLVGGILTPMLEVEARITHLGLTFIGHPISFDDQSLYFQSKSVLEVFHALVTAGRPDMWIVGVLVLMFSVVFPLIKTLALALCLYRPQWLKTSLLARFFALESSKWSMADVMALAIFMTFVAFNGLIPNSMNGLRETGIQLAIPTDSSRILPGYFLFIGFCLAGLFLSGKLRHGLATASPVRTATIE